MTRLGGFSNAKLLFRCSIANAQRSQRLIGTRRLTVIAVMATSVMLAACGEELSCSADATKQLMDQIARTEIKKGFAPGDPTPDKIRLTVKEIVTTDKTKTRATCKAKFEVNTPEAPAGDVPVTYHVEKTDDGRLYVTIFGL